MSGNNCLIGKGFMDSEDCNSLDEFVATGALLVTRCIQILLVNQPITFGTK
jgi:hypothetical protein